MLVDSLPSFAELGVSSWVNETIQLSGGWRVVCRALTSFEGLGVSSWVNDTIKLLGG